MALLLRTINSFQDRNGPADSVFLRTMLVPDEIKAG